jgi:hypothetical protein
MGNSERRTTGRTVSDGQGPPRPCRTQQPPPKTAAVLQRAPSGNAWAGLPRANGSLPGAATGEATDARIGRLAKAEPLTSPDGTLEYGGSSANALAWDQRYAGNHVRLEQARSASLKTHSILTRCRHQTNLPHRSRLSGRLSNPDRADATTKS